MFIRFPIYIKKTGLHNSDPVHHSDDHVISCLNSLGWSLPSRLGSDGKPSAQYETELISPGTVVKDRSLLHYRDLAAKNGARVFGEAGKKEVTKFGIYFGSLPAEQANVYIARITDEVLTVYVTQNDVSKLHACSRMVIDKLMSLPIADRNRTVGQKATVYSSEATSEVGAGTIQERSMRNLLRVAKTDFIVLFLSFALLVLTASLSQAPVEFFGTNVSGLVNFSAEAWKACLGALIGSGISIAATHLRMDRTFIRFGAEA